MQIIKLSYTITFLFIFLLTTQINSYAAYVGNPSRIFTPKEEKAYSVFAEGVADIIYDRGAKHQADDTKVDFYGGVAGIIYKNFFALYGGAGAGKIEESFTIRNKKIMWESDYNFTWLAGGTLKLYERELKDFYNSRIVASVDIQYRNTDTDPDVINIDSTEFNIPHSDIDYCSMEYNDWHLALACGIDMGAFLPYLGIRYSDFESSIRVMQSNIVYQKDNAEADDNLGVFVGAGIKILDSLYANIEAGFIDEDSLSGSLSWRF